MDFDKICFFIFNSDKMWLISILVFSLIGFLILLIPRIASKYKLAISLILVFLGICFIILCYAMMDYLRRLGLYSLHTKPEYGLEMIRPFYPGLILGAIILTVGNRIPISQGNEKIKVSPDLQKEDEKEKVQ